MEKKMIEINDEELDSVAGGNDSYKKMTKKDFTSLAIACGMKNNVDIMKLYGSYALSDCDGSLGATKKWIETQAKAKGYL